MNPVVIADFPQQIANFLLFSLCRCSCAAVSLDCDDSHGTFFLISLLQQLDGAQVWVVGEENKKRTFCWDSSIWSETKFKFKKKSLHC